MMNSVNFKVVIVGDEYVGKTSCIRRFIDDRFVENYKPTLGFEISVKTLQLQETTVILSIWDLAGQGLFEPMRKAYYEGGRGFFVVFDLTNQNTFDHVDNWANEIMATVPGAPIIIIGNKADLPDQVVLPETISQKCIELGLGNPIITSARTGEGILDAFQQLSDLILSKM